MARHLQAAGPMIRLLILCCGLSVLTAVAAHAQPVSTIAPTPDAILRTIFGEGLISGFFTAQVRQIATHYARRTPFAGNVRINEAPDPQALNVYVFHYRPSLPRYLRNGCNAFPADRLILCDHKLLDSIPATPPIKVAGAARRPAPALMYWVLGHEIGHILLEHDRSAFLAFRSGPASPHPVPAPAAAANAAAAPDVRLLNRFETDADRFAISSLPVDTADHWLFFGGPLLDALWWERATIAKQAGATPQQTHFRIGAVEGAHPPMILRLEDLVATVRSTFTTFPFPEGFVGARTYEVERREWEPGGAGKDPADAGLFYGTVYLGSDLPAPAARQARLDRATLLWLLRQDPYAELLRTFVCAESPAATDEATSWQRRFICGTLPDAAAGERLLTYVDGCKERPGDQALRCYGLVPLIGLECRRRKTAKGWCSLERLRALDGQYAGHKFEDGGREGLIEWSTVARYVFETGEAPPDAASTAWTIGIARELIAKRGSSVGWDLLQRHERQLRDAGARDAPLPLMEFHSEAAEIAIAAGSEDRAVAYLRALVSAADAHLGAGDPAHGYVRLRLARTLRHYGLHTYGSNESLGFFTGPEFARRRAASQALRSEAGPMAESAATAFRASLDNARRTGSADAAALHEIYLVALSDVVFSYNLAPDTARALTHARRLHSELAAAPDLRTRPRFGIGVLAPALENIAVAFIAALDGDAALAVTHAREAVRLREGAGDAAVVALRALTAALHASRDVEAARQTAIRYVAAFKKTYGRHIPQPDGVLVRGEMVDLAEIAAARPKGDDKR